MNRITNLLNAQYPGTSTPESHLLQIPAEVMDAILCYNTFSEIFAMRRACLLLKTGEKNPQSEEASKTSSGRWIILCIENASSVWKRIFPTSTHEPTFEDLGKAFVRILLTEKNLAKLIAKEVIKYPVHIHLIGSQINDPSAHPQTHLTFIKSNKRLRIILNEKQDLSTITIPRLAKKILNEAKKLIQADIWLRYKFVFLSAPICILSGMLFTYLWTSQNLKLSDNPKAPTIGTLLITTGLAIFVVALYTYHKITQEILSKIFRNIGITQIY